MAAEILAFIEAICVAWIRDWKHSWIETNSTLVIHYPYYSHNTIICFSWLIGTIVYGHSSYKYIFLYTLIGRVIKLMMS